MRLRLRPSPRAGPEANRNHVSGRLNRSTGIGKDLILGIYAACYAHRLLEIQMNEERILIISRIYEKASDRHQLNVAHIGGGAIAGPVFQYEIWLNNAEQTDRRVTTGNAYHVRRTFINKLLDLADDGWKKQNVASYGDPQEDFFDPGKL